MAVWDELTGVQLDFAELTPEQMQKLVAGIDADKAKKLMQDLDQLVVNLKEHKETVRFAQRVLQLVLLKIITF